MWHEDLPHEVAGCPLVQIQVRGEAMGSETSSDIHTAHGRKSNAEISRSAAITHTHTITHANNSTETGKTIAINNFSALVTNKGSFVFRFILFGFFL
jgi:hypothetical protein